jgi:hypothetical protein
MRFRVSNLASVLSTMRFAAFVLASLVLCLFASAASAGTVSGTVRNGTTGQVAAGVDVILIQLQGGMKPVANTKTDAQGRFQFDSPVIGAAPVLIRAVYRGVNYHEPVPPGKTTADVQIFEPTDKPGSFSVPAHAIILQPHATELLIGEEYSIENKTKPPMAFYRADGSFLFSLPEGAQLNEVSASGSSGMAVVQGTIDKGKNQEAIAFAFRPGESGVRISYKLPYPGNQAKLRFVSPYPAERLAVFAPPSVQISGEGFTAAGQDQGFNVYMRESVAANTPLSVSVSGTAPMPANAGGVGGSGGAVSAPPSAQDAQNPSVNSRVEAPGSEAPSVTATALPARLDGLKWYLVAGFTVLFALGFAFIWRRPQVAVAGAGAAMMEVPAPARRVASVAEAASPLPPSSAASSPSAAIAEVDREVRGSLDELKDNLFRLELRRQAGTITESDYARERERVEKILRDLVRG